MKKYMGFLVIGLFAFMFSSSLALAQTNSATGATGSYKQQVQNIKQEVQTAVSAAKAEIESIRASSQQKMDALKASFKNEKDKVQAKMKQVRLTGREEALTRFDAAVAR